jgi:small conductance mechanosensitive channel
MKKVLKQPLPEIGIEEFGASNLIIAVRPYVLPDDYWEVYYDVMDRIKSVYHLNGIGINFAEGHQIGMVGK